MCGIAGIFHRREGSPDPKVLDAMTDRLARRGPDGRGTYLHEGAGLGHRRLAIIGLSDGAQPMTNQHGNIWVTFNGEIYNYKELRAELEGRGYVFRTSSDTEVLVHGYSAFNTELPNRLRGIFAFVIYDLEARRMFAVRDRLGVKPLFYHLTSDLFLFGSEPKALLAHPEMPRQPDFENVNLFLRLGYLPPHRSCFQGMAQIPPGGFIVVSRNRVDCQRYWMPPELGVGDPGVVAEQMDAQLDDAVNSELMSEVPLGALLSGGIDSSAVAASMARNKGLGERPKTFCIGFNEGGFDESTYSRRVAEHLNLDHHVEMVTQEHLDLLDLLVDVYDEPFGDTSAIPTFELCKMTRRHVTVALSGDGGDEVFAGYRRYKKLEQWGELPKLGQSAVSMMRRYYPENMRGARTLRRLSAPLEKQWCMEQSFLTDEDLPKYVDGSLLLEPSWSLYDTLQSAPGQTLLQRVQWVELQTYLPGDILTKVDRASMWNSLEVRVPLLDHQFVEWAAQLPVEWTYGRDGRGKVALKEHLARRLPPALFERPKMGFGIPLRSWLSGLGDWAERLRARHPKRRFYSPLKVEAIDEMLRDQAHHDQSQGLWALLFLETWWQKNFV